VRTSATFLGTGNYLAPGRYWNSFVLQGPSTEDGLALVEPAPAVLPNLRRSGIDVERLDAIVVSHFHPDHTFGWPFLLLEAVRRGRDRPLHIVGPPGVDAFFADMMGLGSVLDVHNAAHRLLDIRYVEANGEPQEVGPLRFRAFEVDHVPQLRCFGYVFERTDGRRVGYSGDTTPCPGLDALAAASDVLVLECNGPHPGPSHMDAGAVQALRDRFPDLPLVLTHLGEGVEDAVAGIAGVRVPDDFERVEL
jgi:ribonuclease BN (tRNA processing enzyme)